jgi:guanine deaminase
MPLTVIECDYISPIDDKSTHVVRDGALVYDASSAGGARLLWVGKRRDLDHVFKFHRLKRIDRRQFVACPGLFDLHFHWVQDDVRLMPKDSLLKWLEQYTWPYEQRFSKPSYTQKRARRFKRELHQVGTLGGFVYGSLHAESVTEALKQFVGDFVVGNVLMTMNSPQYLCQTSSQALKIVKALAKKYTHHYAVTPRFAPTVHPEVMRESARIARLHDCFIQTHLSENTDEIRFVLELFRAMKGFEKVKSYTDIYHQLGLLGPKTIFGHCLHLSAGEWQLLKRTQSVIAHCPTSNASVKDNGLGSGLFSLEKAERYKIRWALASDIGGGPYLSMFDVMNSFVQQHQKAKVKQATYSMALNRATLESAKIMGLEHRVGALSAGLEANFLLLKKTDTQLLTLNRFFASIKERLQHDRASSQELVSETWYQGRRIFSSSSKTTGQ